MLPGNTLSTVPHPAPFSEPVSKRSEPLIDFEIGGVGLQNPNAGLQVKLWTLRSDGHAVTVEAEDVPPVTLFTRPGTIELVSLAFDQSMNPHVAFVEDGVSWLWWWDTIANAMVFTSFPNMKTPRLGLDERREFNLANSDIVLGYLRGNDFCVRYQRERFAVENVLRVNAGSEVVACARNKGGRYQFRLRPLV